MDSGCIELDDGKIYRKALYLMVKTHGFPVDFPQQTNPVMVALVPLSNNFVPKSCNMQLGGPGGCGKNP